MTRRFILGLMLIILHTAVSTGDCAEIAHATTWYGVQWYYCQWTPEDPPIITNLTYTLEGDTIINDTYYRKLLLSFGKSTAKGYSGAIRQSNDGLQVYYVPCGLPEQGNPSEYLLYDFNVKPDDIVQAYYGFADLSCANIEGRSALVPYTVSDVQIIDGRRHVYVTNDFTGSVEWIEGIGTRHIIWPCGQNCVPTGYTHWHCTLCAADSKGDILYSFNTDYIGIQNNCPDWVPTKVENIPCNTPSATKFLRDGQLLINHDGNTYNANGVLIRNLQ